MNERSRLSLIVTQTLIISLMLALLGRLFYLQIGAGPKYRDAALSIQSRDIVTPATRVSLLIHLVYPLRSTVWVWQ